MQCLEIKCVNPESQHIGKVASAALPTNMQEWSMIQAKYTNDSV
jgi:hypothetical protein